ncbi:MAG: hypothetical protein CVU51_01705 [Deltaproteobacteria bacterium HGW-Deltaproteobacteria-1]|nr:MAG: hypothetical protein CVU51_01705 [Deltaproteobacteria bacterium HGW-Deltaproteobacteria-1]
MKRLHITFCDNKNLDIRNKEAPELSLYRKTTITIIFTTLCSVRCSGRFFLWMLCGRGNNYFQTIEKREPPVLIFDYEILLTGHTLKCPVNYNLVWIIKQKIKASPSVSLE